MSGGIERIGWAVRVERHDRGNRWPAVGWSKNAAHREAEAWADDGYEAEAMPLYAAPEGHIESLEAERDRYRDLADRLKLEAQIHAGEARTQAATVHECYQAASGATGERGDWHGANPVREKIASLEAERDELRATVERYRALEDEGWDLRSRDVPTGGDDSDVEWFVVEHHMAKPHERPFIGAPTPLGAIDNAIAGLRALNPEEEA